MRVVAVQFRTVRWVMLCGYGEMSAESPTMGVVTKSTLRGFADSLIVYGHGISIGYAAARIGLAITAADRHVDRGADAGLNLTGSRCIGASTVGGIGTLTEQAGFTVHWESPRSAAFTELAKSRSRWSKRSIRFADRPYLPGTARAEHACGQDSFWLALDRREQFRRKSGREARRIKHHAVGLHRPALVQIGMLKRGTRRTRQR